SHRAGAFDWSDLLWKIRMQEASVTAQRVGTVRPGDPNHLYLPVDALLMSHGVAPPPESDVAPVRMEIDGESDDENHRRRLKDEEERLKLLLLQPLQEEFNEEGETVDHNDRVEEEEEEEEEIGVDAAHRGVEVLDEVKEHEDDQEEYEEEEKSSFIPAPAAAASSGARLRERRVTAPQPSPAPKKVKAAKKVKLPASLVLQHEQKHGSRWSAWHELPYWDSVGGGPADVMHNIFLGITNDLMSMLTTTMKPESKEALRAFVNSEKQSIEHRIKDSKDVEDMTPHEREKLVWDKEYLARLISASDTLAAKDKSVSILSDANMKALQSFMDNCSVPSDIGRILRKFSSKMSGIKAVEWANWATIFAVPALRTLMQQQQQRQQKKKTPNSRSRVSPPTGPPLLLEQHLDLFIRLQKIATILGGYVISKEQIEEVKELLLEYVKSYEQLFGAAAVKPNHHWAQHIPQMLYDYGPPAGWWCQSYERYNGLLAGLPRTPAFIEICIMRRSILMIEVVRKVNILHDTAGDHAGDGIGPTRDHLAFIQHLISGSVETLSSDCDFLVGECADWKLEMNIQRGRKSFMYHLNGKNWIQTYRSLEATMMDIVTFNKITGTEPYLGCLMGSGKEGDLGVSDNLPLWKGGDRFMPLYYTASRLLGLLQWRYAISYEEKITNSRKASADVPSAALFAKMRQHHGLNIDSNLKHLRGVNPLIRREFTVYDTLVKGDVVFGSRINQRRFINSFVMVPFQLEGPAAKIVMGYGQVQFYFTHIFLDQRHQFALVTWWDDNEAKKHRPHYFSKLCADSFELFPTLNHTADSIREYDLVPVQRIYGRWIPHISKQNNKKVHLALPIPKKNHA
ncbi:MAG: hypothetical protein P4M11_09910, partial [Candidatus Pacebacteria bacterium]|nr:hypothetical protein [Candidatus Paceibacterota bacterium]